jgi:signal transduction histidine kinase
MKTITRKPDYTAYSFRKKISIPLFYSLLFAALASAAFLVLSTTNRSISNSNEAAGTIKTYNSLLNLNQQVDEVQMATLRIIFNAEKDDVAGEFELLEKLNTAYQKAWRNFATANKDGFAGMSFDSLTQFKRKDDNARKLLISQTVHDSSSQYAAINFYYTVQKPIYEDYQHAIQRLSATLETNLQEQLNETNAYVKKSSSVVNWLLIFSFIIMICGGLLVMHQQSRLNKVYAQLISERSDKHAEITRQSLAAQERERNELGRDLHDNVNQLLSVVKLNLSLALEQREKVGHLIPKSIEYLHRAIEEIRLLSRFLVAPVVNQISLYAAIEELICSIKPLASGTHFMLFADDARDNAVSDEIKLTIYRIFQEQITNIIKHADASQVKIDLRITKTDIQLRVADNGKGFDFDALRKGVGINNIINRAFAYKGRAEFDTAPGKGCTLEVRLPILIRRHRMLLK